MEKGIYLFYLGGNIRASLPIYLEQKWEGLRYMNYQPV